MSQASGLEIRAGVAREYADVFTPEAVAALLALRPLDARRVELMQARLERRRARQQRQQRIDFLPAEGTIAGTGITVADARAGRFAGSEIPPDLQRQWIQGTGPGGASRACRSRRASATSPTRCCRAPTAGCSTARTRSARCRRCRSTTSAT